MNGYCRKGSLDEARSQGNLAGSMERRLLIGLLWGRNPREICEIRLLFPIFVSEELGIFIFCAPTGIAGILITISFYFILEYLNCSEDSFHYH